MGWGDNTKGPWGQKPSGKKPNSGQNKPSGTSGSSNSGKQASSSKTKSSAGGGQKVIDIDSFFKKPGGGNGDFKLSGKGFAGLIIVIILGWALTGFYKVDASEEGVVLRFGKYHRSAPEGLRFHLPYPIEKVYIVKKTKINSVQVGYRKGGSSKSSLFTSRFSGGNSTSEVKRPIESLMITGDTNIADVSFTAQWRIQDSLQFLFNISNPEETIKSVAESAMREVIGSSNFAAAMTTRRGEIEGEVQKILQDVLNYYQAGIEIIAVNLNDVQNPDPVMPAFLDVETAKQDRETAINKAKSYENDIIPKARGDAERMVQEAEAYKEKVISVAKGEADRFMQVYREYRRAKDVTKRRMYLETMQEVLSGTEKVVIGEGAGSGVLPYLPLKELGKNKQ